MNKSIMTGQPLLLLTAVMTAMAVCWGAGCAKKSGQEAVPEIPDTLTVISDTLSKIHDTLSETPDTLSEIPNTLIGKRDGKTYKTVTIGKQAWMAENLNYQTGNSWCYENDNSNCEKYGRLYDWKTAKTVCPSGWHLPSRKEWDDLEAAAGGNVAGSKLKSASGWNSNGNGTDEFGFSALPGGYRYTDGSFNNVGYGGYWWTATEGGSGKAYYRIMVYDFDYVNEGNDDVSNGFSVRCFGD